MSNLNVKGMATIAFMSVAGIVGVGAVFGGFYSTAENERHVVTSAGEFAYVSDPGLNFKIPFYQSAKSYPTDIQELQVGPKSIASKGNQTLQDVIVKVQYVIPTDQIEWIHKNAPDYAARLRTLATKAANEVIGTTDTTVLAQNRTAIGIQLEQQIQELVAESGMGIEIQATSLENFEWDPTFLASIQENAQVKNEIVRLEAEEKREEVNARKKVIVANGEAERLRAEAQGQADAARLAAEGGRDAAKARAEGEAFRVAAEGNARAEAFAAEISAFGNPENYVDYTIGQQWDGSVPQIVSGDGGQGMLLDLRSVGTASTPRP